MDYAILAASTNDPILSLSHQKVMSMLKRKFGLIGYPLSHSFSSKYFSEKFEKEGLSSVSYENFPIEKIELLPSLIEQNPDLVGLNVTIPYKQQVIPYMDELSVGAGDIGAVNTIVVHMSGKLSGHNSDIYGFDQSLNILIPETFRSGALILGTGGASKAVEYVCQRRGFPVTFVSRTPGEGQLAYQDVDEELLRQHRLIINTTPLGMHPHIEQCPVLPYELLDSGYYLFDLIYNPAVTQFLQRGKDQQSHIMNGMEMLIFQAEKSWQIWNENTSM